MSVEGFFEIVYDIAIILAVIAFAMCFVYLYVTGGEAKAPSPH